MFISELAEPQLLVIYPGRFQPFHKGHHAVYEWLSGKFGRNNVFIATSNKVEEPKSPFTFAEKSYFMQLTGIPVDRIIQASSPYNIESVLSGGQIQITNPDNTVVIFAVSEKDMAEDPRFKNFVKKNGELTYFQPLKDIKNTKSMKEHGYIMTVPTFQFNVAGDPMQSASELRAEYSTADEKKRQLIIQDLFGRYTREAEQIMTARIPGAQQTVDEADRPVAFVMPQSKPKDDEGYFRMLAYKFNKHPGNLNKKEQKELQDYLMARKAGLKESLLTESQIQDRILSLPDIYEEAAGVGVVKNGKDPRYMTATMGDQNDVTGSTLAKMMKSYHLTGHRAPKVRQIRVKSNIGTGAK